MKYALIAAAFVAVPTAPFAQYHSPMADVTIAEYMQGLHSFGKMHMPNTQFGGLYYNDTTEESLLEIDLGYDFTDYKTTTGTAYTLDQFKGDFIVGDL
ncbi:MAG: hypothetical protein AAF701_08760, partial [Pseudomonadota bacterium]